MLRYTEQSFDTTNHPELMSYFAIPSFKNSIILEIPLSFRKSDNVSLVTALSATVFELVIFVRRESGTHNLVTVMLVHISSISS